jgi:hypothetical protein
MQNKWNFNQFCLKNFAYAAFLRLPVTVGVSCGADFGERSCPIGLNGDARICGSNTTNPALKITLC